MGCLVDGVHQWAMHAADPVYAQQCSQHGSMSNEPLAHMRRRRLGHEPEFSSQRCMQRSLLAMLHFAGIVLLPGLLRSFVDVRVIGKVEIQSIP